MSTAAAAPHHFWIHCLSLQGSISCRVSLVPGEIYLPCSPAAPCGLLHDIPCPVRTLHAPLWLLKTALRPDITVSKWTIAWQLSATLMCLPALSASKLFDSLLFRGTDSKDSPISHQAVIIARWTLAAASTGLCFYNEGRGTWVIHHAFWLSLKGKAYSHVCRAKNKAISLETSQQPDDQLKERDMF